MVRILTGPYAMGVFNSPKRSAVNRAYNIRYRIVKQLAGDVSRFRLYLASLTRGIRNRQARRVDGEGWDFGKRALSTDRCQLKAVLLS
jgi:hypothetical protein